VLALALMVLALALMGRALMVQAKMKLDLRKYFLLELVVQLHQPFLLRLKSKRLKYQ